jgi:hypothetical protein
MVLLAVSMFHVSSIVAIFGIALLFWGAIFLYIAPTKRIPLAMLLGQTVVTMSNIERIINETGASYPGIYLPPANIKNTESSIVAIPKKPQTPIPTIRELTDGLTASQSECTLIIPPGSALCQLFEREFNKPFSKIGLSQLQKELPKLVVNDMQLAEKLEIHDQENTIIVEITKTVLDGVFGQDDFQPKAQKQVGCLLSSAIACGLAKASGHPVWINNEIHDQQTKTTRVEYKIIQG